MTPEASQIYAACDLMIVVGSRLRGNETRNNDMPLPRPLLQVDADASQSGRNYASDFFVHGDAQLVLEGIVARLPKTWRPDPQLALRHCSGARQERGRAAADAWALSDDCR